MGIIQLGECNKIHISNIFHLKKDIPLLAHIRDKLKFRRALYFPLGVCILECPHV